MNRCAHGVCGRVCVYTYESVRGSAWVGVHHGHSCIHIYTHTESQRFPILNIYTQNAGRPAVCSFLTLSLSKG